MVIYFSGTGNSRFVAEHIAKQVNQEMVDATPYLKSGDRLSSRDDVNVFVAPVYAAAPPIDWMTFIRRSSFVKGSQAYFVMTCAAAMSGCPEFCRQLAAEKGLRYMGTAQVTMPQNYIIFFRTKSKKENRRTVKRAIPVIRTLAKDIAAGREFSDPHMKRWEYLSAKLVLRAYYKYFMRTRKFRTEDTCVGCGKCAQMCPLDNITIRDGRPVWGNHCTHCMACINRCPMDAIEYGKRTRKKHRYKGPTK